MTKTIQMVGIPMDLGQSRRGVDMGPSAMRYGGIGKRLRRLGYELEVLGTGERAGGGGRRPEGGMAYLPAVVQACELM
jgi:arginase